MQNDSLQHQWDLDAWCDRFEREWRTDSEPSLARYLAEWTGPDEETLFRHLLELDIDYRLRRGEVLDPSVYRRQFPTFVAVIDGLIAAQRANVTDSLAANSTRPNVSCPGTGTAPKRLGSYEVLEPLGKGGMGIVYRARQIGLNRVVALKTIRSGEFASAEELARFRAEAEAAASLSHPTIVPVYEVGEDQGRLFFSMELVDGESLAVASAARVFEPEEAARIVEITARAIGYAHGKGIVHRDLKPGNILLDRSGQPRIMDFGLAKSLNVDRDLTTTGQVIGTPNYMPPEQAGGHIAAVSPQSDVYSLGAVLYRLVSGRPPFQAANLVDTLRDVLETEAIPPGSFVRGIPRDLDTICLKCLEKSPGCRYAGALELADELARFQRREPIQARPISALERGLRWCRRNRLTTGLTASTLASIIVGVIFAFYYSRAATINEAARIKAEQLSEFRKQTAALKEREAQLAEKSATEARQVSEHAAYARGIGSIYREWSEGGYAELYPGLLRTQANLRGWEFGYLSTLCTARDLRTIAPKGTGGVTFVSGGSQLLSADSAGLVMHDLDFPLSVRVVKQGEIAINAPIVAIREQTRQRLLNVVLQNGHALAHILPTKQTAYLDLELAETQDAKFSSDGRRMIALGKADKPILRLWDWERLAAIPDPGEFEDQPVGIAISSDGSFFAVANESGIVAIGSIAEHEGKLKSEWIWRSSQPVLPRVRDLAFCDQGRTLIVGGGTEVIEVNRDGVRKRLRGNGQLEVVRVACSKSGRFVAVGINNERRINNAIAEFVQLIDRLGGTPMEELPGPEQIRQLEFSDDETRLLCRSLARGGESELRLWQVDRKQHRKTRLPSVVPSPTAIAIDRAQNRVALCDRSAAGKSIFVFDLQSNRVLRRFEHEMNVRGCAFSDCGRFLLVQRGNTEVHLTEWFDLESEAQGQFPAARQDELLSFPQASRGGSFLAAVVHNFVENTMRLRIWSRERGELVFETASTPISPIRIPYTFANVDDSFAFVDGENIIRRSLPEGRELMKHRKPPQTVTCLRFSPNDDRLAVGLEVSKYVLPSRNDEVVEKSLRLLIWDLVGDRRAVEMIGGTGNVQCIDFSPDGRRVLSGDGLSPINQNSAVCVWDAELGFELLRLPLREDEFAWLLLYLGFSSDGRRVAAITFRDHEFTVHEWPVDRNVPPLRIAN